MKLLTILILCYSSISNAFEVNSYASSERGMTIIEIIDDCDFSHKLLISEDSLGSHKVSDWLDLLMISGEYNKCKQGANNTLTK